MQLDYPTNKQGVADCYRDVAITEAEYTALAAQVEAAFDERVGSRSQELAELTENRQRLQNESAKLLAAHLAAAIDLETLKRHQDRIQTGLTDIDRRLASEHDYYTGHAINSAQPSACWSTAQRSTPARKTKASGSRTKHSPTASRSAKTKR